MTNFYRAKARYDYTTDNVIVTEEECSNLVKNLLPKFRVLCQIKAKRAALNDRHSVHYAYYDKRVRDIVVTTDVRQIEDQEQTA
jgi:hypothetical protein